MSLSICASLKMSQKSICWAIFRGNLSFLIQFMFSFKFAVVLQVLVLTFGLLAELDIFRCILTIVVSTYSITFRLDEDSNW